MGKRARTIKHALERTIFVSLAEIVRAVPRKVALSIAGALGVLAFDLVRIRRAVAIENVRERLAPPGGRPEAVRIARASYRVMARTFVDLIRLDRFGEKLWRVLDRSEMEWFVQFRDQHRRAVLVSGHFGNWELLALGIQRMGLTVNAIAADQANAAVNDYIREVRDRAGIRVLSSRGGLREALRALRADEYIATLMDQDARGRGAFLDFLDTPAATHTGIVSLAVRTESPLVPGVLIDEGGRYRFVHGEPWCARPGASEEENLRAGAAHFNRFLEELVRRHPENYFWAHRRWKTIAPGASGS